MFKKIRNSILMSLCVIFLFSNISFAAIYPDTFRVQGNQIVNSLNQPVKFYGVGIFEDRRFLPQKHWNDTFLTNAFNTARQWGSNVVRINLMPAYYRHIGIDNYLKEIETYVNYAKKHNLYIILNWHSIICPFNGYMLDEKYYPDIIYTTTEEITEVWEAIAKHFVNENVILAYELLNEPLTAKDKSHFDEWMRLKNFYETEVISKIRQYDQKKIIICNGPDATSELRYALTNPVNGSNISYGFHPFPWNGRRGPHTTGLDNYNAWVRPTVQQKPVIITEFSYWNIEQWPTVGPDLEYALESFWPGPGRFREDLMKFIKENSISWIVVQFQIDNHPTERQAGHHGFSLVNAMWEPNFDFGYFFRDHLFEEAEKGKVHVNVPNATFTWTINGGNRNTYVNGDIVEIVPNAKYVVTTSLGHRIEVEINSVNDTFNITQLATPSSGGGGGCNTTNTDTSHAITILMFVCLLYVITKKQNVK